jgi:hypothetical protein
MNWPKTKPALHGSKNNGNGSGVRDMVLLNTAKAFWGRYKLVFYIMRHPFDGFYQMKHEKKGTMGIAFLNLFLLWVSYSFQTQYSSLVVSQRYPLAMHSIWEGFSLLSILVLWSVANWSVTSLTDGEGKLKEIIMANCYAMTPMILLFIPATLLSNILADGEAAFYFMILYVAITYFILLAYVGMVTVHNFSAGKALATLVLTVIALLIIAFLIGLLFTLWQQLYTFVYSIYIEIIYRY